MQNRAPRLRQPSDRLRQPLVADSDNIDASCHTPLLPDNVVLHPDDSNSKVFHAIARALLSVDNRALTIKDLAELCLNNGLAAQNLSAASQAITTYIRAHLQRCEEQDDIPLLCRHTLSGTSVDDSLLPALCSTSGGAQCPIDSASRSTNFRRGTVIWYLSRATGAPCPFTRAGLRLSQFTDKTRPSAPLPPPRDRRTLRDREKAQADTATLKRKRAHHSSSPADSQSETERPPPKVKITLRLKPIPSFATSTTGPIPKTISSRIISISDSEDSDASMSSDCFSQHSTSHATASSTAEETRCLPPYPRRSISIPCYTPSVETPYLYFPPVVPQSSLSDRRSPSVPHSVASPPPDSDDEGQDFFTARRCSDGLIQPPLMDDDSDWDADSEPDADTSWEDGLSLRSPSARSLSPPIVIKGEPDCQTMLDIWEQEDPLAMTESSFHRPFPDRKIKQEEIEPVFFDYMADDEKALSIKTEESSLLPFAHDLYDSPNFDASPSPRAPSASPDNSPSSGLAGTPEPQSPGSSSNFKATHEPIPSSLLSLIESMTMEPVPPVFSPMAQEPCVSLKECSASNNVIVPIGLPADAPLSATQIEGIPVYQMDAGTYTFLRRIDSNFVNLQPLANWAHTPYPVWSTIPNATTVTEGSPHIAGTWVSLATAQAYARDHSLHGGYIDLFLSEDLHQSFPASLQDHHRAHAQSKRPNEFGTPFGSSMQPYTQSDVASILPSSSIPSACAAMSPAEDPDSQLALDAESPLSPTEEEMFHALCQHSGWDEDSQPSSALASTEPTLQLSPAKASRQEKQALRRSKRVADAQAAHSQGQASGPRSRRRGSRNSVS